MSRIGKKPILIPTGVTVKVQDGNIIATGPQGELSRRFSPGVAFRIEDSKVFVTVENPSDKVIWGLNRALLANAIQGVAEGFEKKLEFNGVGFKAQARLRQPADRTGGDAEIELNLGYTNPVVIKALPGVSFLVEKNIIKVKGIDREAVGQVAALIRRARPPEPYKGSGIKYVEEVIQRKAGKKAVAGA